MTTDTELRALFEQDMEKEGYSINGPTTGIYYDPKVQIAYEWFIFGYVKSQRDLIEALKPVGYMSHVTIRTISCGKPATAYPVASSWVKYPLYILPEHAQKIQDMGFLPEDTPK